MSATEPAGGQAGRAVRVTRDGPVGRVELARADKANALRLADKAAVTAAIRDLADQDAVRVIVLSSARPGVFCAGTDIREMATMGPDEALAMFDVEAEMFQTVLDVRVPVVAAVDGVALGAGCILAFCADLCVATARSRFGQPEVRNAVPAPAQIAALTYVVGFNRARSLLLTGRELSGHEAESWGLIARCVETDGLDDEVGDLVAHLSGLPRRALALQKQILADSLQHGYAAATASSRYVAAHAFTTDEPRDAIERFLTARAQSKRSGG